MVGSYIRTQEIRDNISKRRKGMKFTAEHRNNLRLAKLGRKLSPISIAKRTATRKANGYKHSLETREKISRANKGQVPWIVGKHITEKHKEIIRQYRLTHPLARENTGIERLIQDELSNREIAFYPHYPVKGQPDIAFPDKKIAIFCDGCYWHNCRKCKFMKDKKNMEVMARRDGGTSKFLRENGWRVLRYWEHEINANPSAVVDEIEDILYV